MAYTKSPTQDSHNVVRLPAAGSPFVVTTSTTNPAATLNYIDCFPLTEKQWGADERRTVQKREAWKVRATCTGTVTTSTNISKVSVPAELTDYVFFGVGDTYYYCNYNTAAVASWATGSNSSSAYLSSGTNAIDSTNARRIAFLGYDSFLKTCLEDGTSATSTDLSAIGVIGNKGLVYIDGYLFAVSSNGNKIYNSGTANALTTWATTDFIDAEQFGDPTIWIDKHKNYLVAFGSNSVEFFYNSGIEVGSPVTRQESYASRIGIRSVSPGRFTARIGDTLYFVGKSSTNSLSLYKIENFQVKEVQGQWAGSVMNFESILSPGNAFATYGVQTVIINNNPMVQVFTQNEAGTMVNSIMYFPKEDAWWQLSADGSTFPHPNYQVGSNFYESTYGFPFTLSKTSEAGSTITIWEPDQAHATSITAYIYSEVVDLGTNRWKHLARMDAIGEYGNNSVTLSYNFTPDYSQTYTSCGAITQSSIGKQNNVSWYNLGAVRRGSFKFAMSGTSHAIHEGLDLEYTVGVA